MFTKCDYRSKQSQQLDVNSNLDRNTSAESMRKLMNPVIHESSKAHFPHVINFLFQIKSGLANFITETTLVYQAH